MAKDMNTSLPELKKLEALKYNLTQLIIHDLQSPISSTMTAIDLFEQRRKGSLSLSVKDLMEKIKRNCQVQIDLISDILEINRMENNELKLEKRKIDIYTLVEECVLQVEPFLVQKDIKFTKAIHGTVKIIIADEVYLHRVIINLVMNSIKYTERGGSIELSVHPDPENSGLLFCIKDTGLGIDKENIHRIFDRFFQVQQASVKRARRGVGLGLAFCRMAVEAHGGRIWAESTEGNGSFFYFTIPQ